MLGFAGRIVHIFCTVDSSVLFYIAAYRKPDTPSFLFNFFCRLASRTGIPAQYCQRGALIGAWPEHRIAIANEAVVRDQDTHRESEVDAT